MQKNYVKPVVSILPDTSEGVYTASGAAQGTLHVTYQGAWDRWSTGGKGHVSANWSDITGTITLNLSFNDTVDEITTDDSSVNA